jgi:hypothetical protein
MQLPSVQRSAVLVSHELQNSEFDAFVPHWLTVWSAGMRQMAPAQHPGQSNGSHSQYPLQVSPSLQRSLLPQRHTPPVHVSPFCVVQSPHTVPGAPQVVAVWACGGRHRPFEQQPLVHSEGSQVQRPPLQREPSGHIAPGPQPQTP